MPRRIETLEDAAAEIRHLRDRLDSLEQKNIELNGRRITGAGHSVQLNDYVTRKELNEVKDAG